MIFLALVIGIVIGILTMAYVSSKTQKEIDKEHNSQLESKNNLIDSLQKEIEFYKDTNSSLNKEVEYLKKVDK